MTSRTRSTKRDARGSAGNVLAALASFFVPGLGQLVQGRLLAAMFYFVCVGGLYLVSPLTLGILWIPGAILHLFSIAAAATFRPAH